MVGLSSAFCFLSRWVWSGGADHVSRPAYRLAQGERAIRAGDWNEVQSYIEKLEKAGHADEAHLLRGKVYYAEKRPGLALSEFEAIKVTSPLHLSATAEAGRCLLDLGA